MTDEQPSRSADDGPSTPRPALPITEDDEDDGPEEGTLDPGASADIQLVRQGLYSLDAALANQERISDQERLQLRSYVAACHAGLTALKARLGHIDDGRVAIGLAPRSSPLPREALDLDAGTPPQVESPTLRGRLSPGKLAWIALIAAAVTALVLGALLMLTMFGSEESEWTPPPAPAPITAAAPEVGEPETEAPADSPSVAEPVAPDPTVIPVIPSSLPSSTPFPFPMRRPSKRER
ncbi:MAG: hypothetical protein JRI23_15120 [Deltaproteobacteria bacterium]|jgi:hypothetical protein|nr:hypothetical protein [Deltaproteobacteria bacterium]MBW2533079.1 hypothetical protein [Deltaproteobacteria bacterium]